MTYTTPLPTEEGKREAARRKHLEKMHEKSRELEHTYYFMRREYRRQGREFANSMYGLVLMKAMEARDMMYQDLTAGRICHDYHRMLKTMMVERRLYHDLMDHRSQGRLNRELENKFLREGAEKEMAAEAAIADVDLGPDMRRVFGKMDALRPQNPADPKTARYAKILEKFAFRNLAEKIYSRCRRSIEAASSPQMQKEEVRGMEVPKLKKEQIARLSAPALQPLML